MNSAKTVELQELSAVTIRFAGDSGDGMQLTGDQFTNTSAFMGNDISTLPDFPAEIRAPAGTLPGVSGFQLNFSSTSTRTSGDFLDVLVAMNPAALKVNLQDLKHGGLLIVNEDAFTANNMNKIGMAENPLKNNSLKDYQLINIPIVQRVQEALNDLPLKRAEVERCKNFYALGLVYWLYDRELTPTQNWIRHKFGKKPEIAEANLTALKAGYVYADVAELFRVRYQIHQAPIEKGTYRKIAGNEGMVLGLVAASHLADVPIFYGSYPITPASDILHQLARYKNFNVRTFQAEDEIAAVGAAIGASYAGHIGVTGTSGPGICLKSEAIGLAVITELPLVIINVQRAGPSTGLPTKLEQADLLQAFFGRNGESPVAILAPKSPTDCFDTAIEAVRIATQYMVPVIVLSDNYVANSSEPWKIPKVESLPEIPVQFRTDAKDYHPYMRNPETLARPWVRPGTKDMEHRIGGLEKSDIYGHVSYDADNHEKMVHLRQEKIERIAKTLPPLEIYGDDSGDLLLVGWGGSYGAITSAVESQRKKGLKVSSIHLRHINPFPSNLGDILSRFKKILVPELNMGQLSVMLHHNFPVEVIPISKMKGRPFLIRELEDTIAFHYKS